MMKSVDYFTDHQNQLRVNTVHVQECFTGQPLDRVFCRCYISPHRPGKSPVCTGPVPGEIWWPDLFSHESVVNKNHQNNQVKTCRSDVLILFCSCPIFWISVMLKDADFFFHEKDKPQHAPFWSTCLSQDETGGPLHHLSTAFWHFPVGWRDLVFRWTQLQHCPRQQ